MSSVDTGFDYRSTQELVAALRAREVSAVELLERSIARIEACDGDLNAVVVRDYERARDAAVAADAALQRGERGLLLGIPMTVKESYNVAGLPTTWGMPAHAEWRAGEDAVAIAKLKAAGAVILGKTNVPLLLMDWQSYNDVYGTTNNPWDVGRSPGGSSGGSAAALAAGYVSLEIGSDIGGSIRVPAHYCGLFGHKPTYGLLAYRGHAFPGAGHSTVDLSVIGPLARTAGDLSLALDVLAGPDEDEALAYRLALPPARHTELAPFRVLVLDAHPLVPTSNEIRAALASLTEKLVRTGATVSQTSALLPDLARATRIYMQLLSAATSARMPAERIEAIRTQLAKLAPDDDSLGAWNLRGAIMAHRDWLVADAERGRINRQWRELFKSFDVVVCPPMPTTAFPHDHSPQDERSIQIDGAAFPYMDQIAWPSLASLSKLPATVAPLGRSEGGLPLGVQIIGPHLEDRTTLGFAALLEREFGGFVPPPRYAS